MLEARTFVDDIGEAGTSTFASQVRRALAEDNRRVHAHLAGLRHIEFAGAAGAPGCEQCQAWERLQASGAKEIPKDFDLPPVGAARNTIGSDLNPQSRYRAFETSTMMALRKGLRRGSTWVNHSITFRARESMLIADADWDGSKELHHQILGLPSHGVCGADPGGCVRQPDDTGRGQVDIGADKLLHLSPIRPMDEDVEPRKTREAVFKHIGFVQLPDLLLEVDAATHFSEALLACRPSTSNELLAVCSALLAQSTDFGAKGVGSMIPGIDTANISTAMRAVELSGRLPGPTNG